MTLLQALEHTRWDLRLTSVLERPRSRFICEVCDNEFGYGKFAVFEDPKSYETFYVDLGLACAWDLEKAIKAERR